MRCPDRLVRRLAALACALAPLVAAADPAAAKADIEARLRTQLPGLARADYLLGSAAFDPDVRAQEEANAGAAKEAIERGAQLWQRKFKDGRSLAACFPNGGRRVAAAYPQYHTGAKRIFTLEMAINQCLKTHKEPLLDYDDPRTMGAVTAYLRSLSAGQPIGVRIPAAAEPLFEQGRRLYFTRMGQRNFACASCHVVQAGRRFADVPLSPAIGQAARWPFIRDGDALTLQAQMRACLERMGAAPFPAASEELNDLEYFLTYLSNGLPMKPNAWRPK